MRPPSVFYMSSTTIILHTVLHSGMMMMIFYSIESSLSSLVSLTYNEPFPDAYIYSMLIELILRYNVSRDSLYIESQQARAR
jgi:hypothetical protein